MKNFVPCICRTKSKGGGGREVGSLGRLAFCCTIEKALIGMDMERQGDGYQSRDAQESTASFNEAR